MQSAHAIANFAIEHEVQFKAWQLGSNYLCCLSSNLKIIEDLIIKLKKFKIACTVFREPDLNNEITAITVESLPHDLHKFFFKNYKLALNGNSN